MPQEDPLFLPGGASTACPAQVGAGFPPGHPGVKAASVRNVVGRRGPAELPKNAAFCQASG